MRNDLNPQSVHGWLSKEEGEVLRGLARSVPEGGTILEIGTHHGRSTMYLAQGASVAGAKVVTLEKDPGCQPKIRQAIETFEAEEVVEPHIADSLEFVEDWALGREIDLLFIDACHEYEAVIADFRLCRPFMAPDGIIVYHDFNPDWWPGCHRAIMELHPDLNERLVAQTLNMVAVRVNGKRDGVDPTSPEFFRRVYH